MARKKKLVFEQLADSLEEFADSLERGEDFKAKYRHHAVTLDLERKQYDAAAVKKIRRSLDASQRVFADFLAVSRSTVTSWEQGVNTPSPLACRVLDEIRINPYYWRARLRASIKDKAKKAG